MAEEQTADLEALDGAWARFQVRSRLCFVCVCVWLCVCWCANSQSSYFRFSNAGLSRQDEQRTPVFERILCVSNIETPSHTRSGWTRRAGGWRSPRTLSGSRWGHRILCLQDCRSMLPSRPPRCLLPYFACSMRARRRPEKGSLPTTCNRNDANSQVKGLLDAFLRDLASQAEEFDRLQPLAAEDDAAADSGGGGGAVAGGGQPVYTTKAALAFIARWRGAVTAGRARVGFLLLLCTFDCRMAAT